MVCDGSFDDLMNGMIKRICIIYFGMLWFFWWSYEWNDKTDMYYMLEFLVDNSDHSILIIMERLDWLFESLTDLAIYDLLIPI